MHRGTFPDFRSILTLRGTTASQTPFHQLEITSALRLDRRHYPSGNNFAKQSPIEDNGTGQT
ncbi:predicted protein [Uncinocarpus reesii 1704]|uniref:Uncharacterized protein n=1 Tax=Uncinocarpus reesii (strain UAMH 1704) TaxID=336963 RepID=C4JDV5_UNCRE|nr:uncharacterized protein UREG_00582 [Uncinocarpus reesii 1704]EEP75735.1 predicted protein [Uncinocarpus reesii 1704]